MNNIEIIKAIDIKQIISKETGLSFKKDTLSKCPFCESGTGKNKSSGFNVKANKNIFTCFVCGKTGGSIEFVRDYKGLKNGEALKYIAEKYANLPKYEPQPEIKTDLSKSIYAISKNSIKPAIEYLESRGVETKKLPSNSFMYDSYKGGAVVFIDSENKLINKRVFEPVENQPKVLQAKGSVLKNAIYDKTYISTKNVVFIVEGVINAFSLFPYSSIAIFSTNNKFTNIEKLSKYLTNKKVVLAFDNDKNKDNDINPGKECNDSYKEFILNNIEVESLSTLLLPENKDINDLLQAKELNEFLKNTDNYQFHKIDLFDKPLTQNSKNLEKNYKTHGFFIKESKYWIRKYIKNNKIDVDLSDCVMEVLYKLNDDLSTRIVKLQQTEVNGKQQRKLIELTSEDLSKDKFKRKLSDVSFSFLGTQENLDRILMYNKHREKEAEMIETYGWQPESKMFVLSDCAISSESEMMYPNNIGMIEDTNTKKSYYLQTAAPVQKDKSLQEFSKSFRYKTSEMDFKKFAELFYYSNEQNGSIGTMFYILSLFRDIIVRHLDFFPYLFLYGTAGGGKTTYSEILTGLFGDTSKGVDLKNISQAGLSRIASQKRNTITYYKEYKTDAEAFVEQYFKSGYDCVSRTISKGGISKDTINFSIESSGLLDSNFLPTNEEAVFSRMIILDFDKAKFTQKEVEAFRELNQYKEIGLVQITKEVLKYRNQFEDNFKDVYYTVLDDLKKGNLKDFKDRERAFKHVALILTPFHILNDVLEFPFSAETLENIMIEHAKAQYEKLNEFKSTTIFWQALAYWKNENKLKQAENGYDKNKAHYYKKTLTNETGIIYLKSTRLVDLHLLYVSYCKSRSIPFDSFPELKSKLITQAYEPFILPPQTPTRKSKAFNINHIGSSYAFAYEINKNDSDIIYIDGVELGF